MAIKQVDKYFLGALLTNPKVYYTKIKELIDTLNGITDGTYSFTNLTVDSLTATTASIGTLTVTKSTVTQATSITTGVTINASAGVITTVSSTIAAGGTATFTVTNSKCTSSSVILLMADGSNTTGTLIADASNIGNGSFKINLKNIHASAAFNNILKFHFLIV